MLFMREPGEYIRRRYPAKLKTIGNGTLYITTKRVAFEHPSDGLCLDLHFKWLYEWWPTGKRTVALTWFEPDPEQKGMVSLRDQQFRCDLTLERRKDQYKPDSVEFHYALCFAYTENCENVRMQGGWYVGADGKGRNHFDLRGPAQDTIQDWSEKVKNSGLPGFDADMKLGRAERDIEKYFEGATGERLIDQEWRWRGRDIKSSRVPKRPFRRYEPNYDKIPEWYAEEPWTAPKTAEGFEEMFGFRKEGSGGLWSLGLLTRKHERKTREEGKAYLESELGKKCMRHLKKVEGVVAAERKACAMMVGLPFENRNQAMRMFLKIQAEINAAAKRGESMENYAPVLPEMDPPECRPGEEPEYEAPFGGGFITCGMNSEYPLHDVGRVEQDYRKLLVEAV